MISGKQLTVSKEWIGKTIDFVHGTYDKVLIRFSDGSYAKIFKEEDHYSDSVELVIYSPLDIYEQRILGLISDEEYEEIQRKEKEEMESKNREWERKQYEQLKKKFEK